jgi:hypothetical protein
MRPEWTNEEAVIEWGVKRFKEIWDEAEYFEGSNAEEVPAFIPGMGWTTVTPPAHQPTKAHEMMLGLIKTDEERKLLLKKEILPEGQAEIAEWARCGWTEPVALLLQQYFNPVAGFRRVQQISPEITRVVLEIVRGERNPKTGKLKDPKTGKWMRGPRKKAWAEKHAWTPTHDAAEFVPVIKQYLSEAHPGRNINDLADEIAAHIKDVRRSETVTDQRKRGPRDRHRARQRVP